MPQQQRAIDQTDNDKTYLSGGHDGWPLGGAVHQAAAAADDKINGCPAFSSPSS